MKETTAAKATAQTALLTEEAAGRRAGVRGASSSGVLPAEGLVEDAERLGGGVQGVMASSDMAASCSRMTARQPARNSSRARAPASVSETSTARPSPGSRSRGHEPALLEALDEQRRRRLGVALGLGQLGNAARAVEQRDEQPRL